MIREKEDNYKRYNQVGSHRNFVHRQSNIKKMKMEHQTSKELQDNKIDNL